MEHLADKLKELRKGRGLSQEELAAFLQISFQSVSKWERGVGCPDISMLVRLARFYKISVDELLDVNGGDEMDELDEIQRVWENDNAKGENLRNVERMRNALKRFPANYDLMIKLVKSLEKCDGTEEDVNACRCEAIELSERIIRYCPDIRIRNDMQYNICYSYWNIGEREQAIERAKQLPGMIKTRENALVTFFEGEERIKVAQEGVITLMSLLYHQMSGLLREEHYPVDERINLWLRYLKNCDSWFEKNDVQEILHCEIGAHMKLARLYFELSDRKKMIENMRSVELLLIKSAECERSQKPESLLSDAIIYKSTVNAEYKRNWVLNQLEQYLVWEKDAEIENIYKRIKEMD